MKRIYGLVLLSFVFILSSCGADNNMEVNLIYNEGEDAVLTEVNVTDLPVPEKDDLLFDGWYLDENLSVKATSKNITEKANLYAKWIDKYQQIFFTDDNGNRLGSIDVEVGTVIDTDLFITPPVIEGYEFDSWVGEEVTIMPGYDLSYKAEYIVSYCEVNYYLDGTLVYTERTGPIGLLFQYEVEVDGYILDNWYEEETFENVFPNDTCDEGIHEAHAFMMPIETDLSSVLLNYSKGDLLYFEGEVVSFSEVGYYLSNGVNALYVFNDIKDDSLQIGDYVIVKGSLTNKEGATVITDVTFENAFDPGFNVDDMSPINVSNITDLLALDITDPLNFGKLYTITGTLSKSGDVYKVIQAQYKKNENTDN